MLLRSVLCMIIVFECNYVYGKSLNYAKGNNTDIDYKLIEIDVDNELTAKEHAVDVLETGRKKGGNVVVIPQSDSGHSGAGYWEPSGYGGKKKKGKGKKNKMKWKKHAWPIGIAIMIMKALLYHLILKKVALLSIASFIIGKVSLILSTMIALKLFFFSHHNNAATHKLEVVHIPIHKHHGTSKKKSYIDNFYQSSPPKEEDHKQVPKYIPISTAEQQELTTIGYYYDNNLSFDITGTGTGIGTGSGYPNYYSDEQNMNTYYN